MPDSQTYDDRYEVVVSFTTAHDAAAVALVKEIDRLVNALGNEVSTNLYKRSRTNIPWVTWKIDDRG